MSKNRKVISIVTNDFKNDSRVLKEVVSLASNGYSVSVLALHDGDLPEQEYVSNVAIRRLKLFSKRWPKTSFFQVFKYMEFLIRSFVLCRSADILHCNDLDTLPIGYLIKKFANREVKIVYDAHEYETEVLGLFGFKKSLAEVLERYIITCADRVITVSDSIANEYVRKYSIVKPVLVLNCPYYAEVRKNELFRGVFDIRNDQKIFLYQGGLGPGRGIELVLEAFVNLDDDKAALVFMGYGPFVPLVKQKAALSANIFYHEAVPPKILLEYTASADFGIAVIEDTCLNYRYCLPNKVFEYLMAGLPILVSNLVEMASLISNNNIGIVVQENTVDGLVAAIRVSLATDFSILVKSGEKARKIFNWEEQERKLLDVYACL